MSESCGELPPPKGQNANDKQRAMTIPTTTFRALGPGTVLLAQVPYYSVSNLPSALSQRDALTLLTSEARCPTDKGDETSAPQRKKNNPYSDREYRDTAFEGAGPEVSGIPTAPSFAQCGAVKSLEAFKGVSFG